jgi:hypothetical protein
MNDMINIHCQIEIEFNILSLVQHIVHDADRAFRGQPLPTSKNVWRKGSKRAHQDGIKRYVIDVLPRCLRFFRYQSLTRYGPMRTMRIAPQVV